MSDAAFKGAVAAAGAVLAIAIAWLRFGYELSIPARPPKPDVSAARARAIALDVERDPGAYAEYLRRDSVALGIRPVSVADASRVIPYVRDDEPRTLRPGTDDAVVRVGDLRLTASVQRQSGSGKQLMILAIDNMSSHPIAYRVVTLPSVGTQACHDKLDLPHNAIAVAARSGEVRSECGYRPGWSLQIVSVETMALSDLSFHYVSRLYPAAIGLDARSARGHRVPSGPPCNVLFGAEVVRDIEAGFITWRDLIDFYARHRCETYTFPDTYRAFQRDGERELPADGAE